MNLAERLAARAEECGAKTALDCEGRALSFEELFSEASRAAALLESLGVQPGDRVALLVPRSPEFVVFHLAALSLGAISLPLNDRCAPGEAAYFLEDSGARVLVSDQGNLNRLALPHAEFPGPVVVSVDGSLPDGVHDWPRFAQSSSAAEFIPRPAAGSDPAMICYTSGTTGKPKGAVITQANLVSNMDALNEAWRWTGADVLLHALPLFHIHGLVVALHGAFNAGSTVIMLERFDAARVSAALETLGCSLFMGVPTMYRRLVELWKARGTAPDLARMRLFVSGSAPLPQSVFEDFRSLTGHAILERYGMTEAGMITSNPYDPAQRRPGSAGYPLRGVEVRVVAAAGREAADVGREAADVGREAADAGRELPPGETGEVQVRGPNVITGYWNAPEKTHAAFDGSWFRTGDLGRLDPADGGRLFLAGRARELIISGGFNVYPGEVEELLASRADIEEAAVVGVADEDLGERVVAVVVPAAGGGGRGVLNDAAAAAGLTEDLRAFCRENLSPYKQPRTIVFRRTLPRNAMGKVQKDALRAELGEEPR